MGLVLSHPSRKNSNRRSFDSVAAATFAQDDSEGGAPMAV
jgi:hypothetical protein